ncbi:MAG: DedA family protein [Polyangiales bacterium]
MNPGQRVLELLERLDAHDAPLGAAIITASSFLEHVFPPFPGDLGVTLGAAVGFAREWPIYVMFPAAVLGSTLGSTVAWTFGRWLEHRSHFPKHPWVARAHEQVLDATKSLEKHGLALVVGSRFLPGVRAFVVVATGFRRFPLLNVLAAAGLGATLWNALLFSIAALVGRNLSTLGAWLDAYNRVALLVVAAIVLVALLRRAWLRRRAGAVDRPPPR